MGQGMSCVANPGHFLCRSIESGDLELVKAMVEKNPSLLSQTANDVKHLPLHVAAANGQIEILSFLLDRSVKPDVVNRRKQTPLMLAAMHGKVECLKKLIEAGANILKFDSHSDRTCLHHAAYYGHVDCLQAILSAARSSSVAASWGFARFVNIRDGRGATPLHLAARQRRAECVHVLLGNGALPCAFTGGFGCPGSTPLHLAARGGSLDCIRELLAWGADRLQRDSSGRVPYLVALKHKHIACAALLNPASMEPLVWPSPLKFISELNQEAKVLLERALIKANREREKNVLKDFGLSCPSNIESVADDALSEVSESDLCCVCFEQVCTIEIQDCGHQMCAQCTLALCCHNKPNPTTALLSPPVCPFCRSTIVRLVIAESKSCGDSEHEIGDVDSPKLLKGSSSFKGLSATFGKMSGRGSGRFALENEWADKP